MNTTRIAIPTRTTEMPATVGAKIDRHNELTTKSREVYAAMKAAENAIPEAAKRDTATRAQAILGDKKAGTPTAEAEAREHLAALQREHAAYTVALATTIAEVRDAMHAARTELAANVDTTIAATRERAANAVATLELALTELGELRSLAAWVAEDFTKLGKIGRHPGVADALRTLHTYLTPPPVVLAGLLDDESELAEVPA